MGVMQKKVIKLDRFARHLIIDSPEKSRPNPSYRLGHAFEFSGETGK